MVVLLTLILSSLPLCAVIIAAFSASERSRELGHDAVSELPHDLGAHSPNA